MTQLDLTTPPSADGPPPEEQPAGSSYWRGVEEYAQSAEFHRRLADEFPDYDPEELRSMSRRSLLKFAAASMALAGLTLTGCRRWPKENIVPYAARPEGKMPGEPEFYASVFELSGVAQPTLVKSFDGRPIKIEGNGEHPACTGASTKFAQASVLDLYDPYRAKTVTTGKGEQPSTVATWATFERLVEERFVALRNGEGNGDGDGEGGSDASSFAVLAQPQSGPTFRRMRAAMAERYPGMRWYTYEPLDRHGVVRATRDAFGKAARPRYHLDRAAVIACFDCDLFESEPDSLNHAAGWAAGRRTADTDGQMNRMYAVEPGFSVTGSVADERLAVKPSQAMRILTGLAAELGVARSSVSLNGSTDFVKKLARDLQGARGRSIVAAGSHMPAAAHRLCFAINQQLNNLGNTIEFTDEPLADQMQQPFADQLAELTRAIDGGEVKHLLILGGNPAYDAPADVNFAGAMDKLDTAVHLSAMRNETSARCDMHLPEASWLEAWGDAHAWDGTLSVQQPLILPIFADANRTTGGRSAIEVLALVLGDRDVPTTGLELVRETFREQKLVDVSAGFERSWRTALHNGYVEDSALDASSTASISPPSVDGLESEADWEVAFRPGTLYDGRFASNGWLQELPQPVTMVTWDNPATIGYDDAKKLGVKPGDVIRLSVDGGGAVEVPVNITFGQARGAISLGLGYGRELAGPVGTGVGSDSYVIRMTGNLSHVPVTVEKTGQRDPLALTAEHHLVNAQEAWALDKRVGKKAGEGGYILKEARLGDYVRNPGFVDAGSHVPTSEHGGNIPLQLWEAPSVLEDGGYQQPNPLGPKYFNEPHAWGMAIDMNSCTGCSACVIACQAENNIPVVGKDEVRNSREMHWLRIDRYFKGDKQKGDAGDPSKVEVRHMPVACVHCENAPCEQVCPVAATVHDTEGLNTMVYNRCIGTRYCSNNCPYKVRRFNFLDYHARDLDKQYLPWIGMPDSEQNAISEIKRMVYNPDVTVRMRGVMEKCTYCTQRISRAKIHAKTAFQRGERTSPLVADGEVVTACQQACPTGAIVFGNLNDPDARVSKLTQKNPRSYSVLKMLNTRPRTSHLAKITNPA
ncbi:MAG: TAT-variant-translocated molybdopterin oxidoreductase [Phycisphaeraceae bacterium]